MDSGISRGAAATALVLLVVFVSVAVAYGQSGHHHGRHAAARVTTSMRPLKVTTRPKRPNIVFVLTDDLSMDLVRYMPQVQAMERQGVTFNNYFVTDSLCCPSRSSIFTGDLPHDTGVFTNTGRKGGFRAFYTRHDQRRSFNVYLQRAGYRTAMMGKYLNGYLAPSSPVPATYVPPGWNGWDVAGNGYPEFHYRLNENGTLHRFGGRPADYLVDVMARKGANFVRSSARSGKPFFLELAPFAPHKPYAPAPRYAGTEAGLRAPHPPSYDVLPTNPPSWLSGHRPLTRRQQHRINHAYDLRVEDVQAVDDMIRRIRVALRATGQLRNTYIVFSSDNGLHMGEYRLTPGKLTAFDTDIHVPLVIDGPGIPAGAVTNAMSENIDLGPTFEQIAGTHAPCDGHTLMPLLHGGTPTGWRNAVLVEHHRPKKDQAGSNPDAQQRPEGNPPSYEAMRTPGFTYVTYRNGQHEFYDLRNDPFELHNIYNSLSQARKNRLQQALARMKHCHGHRACWAAGHVQTGT